MLIDCHWSTIYCNICCSGYWSSTWIERCLPSHKPDKGPASEGGRRPVCREGVCPAPLPWGPSRRELWKWLSAFCFAASSDCIRLHRWSSLCLWVVAQFSTFLPQSLQGRLQWPISMLLILPGFVLGKVLRSIICKLVVFHSSKKKRQFNDPVSFVDRTRLFSVRMRSENCTLLGGLRITDINRVLPKRGGEKSVVDCGLYGL